MNLAWKTARLNLAGKGGGVKTSATTAISRAEWEQHFASVYANSQGVPLDSISVGNRTSAIFDQAVHPTEITKAREAKKNMRAPGPDGFRVDFLRVLCFDETVTRAIANFFTMLLQTAEIPDDWDHAFLFVLYKGKGDPSDPNNYHGITLKSQFLKLFETVLCNRFIYWCSTENVLPPEQLAYRPGFSGTDHLYILNILAGDAIARGKTLFVGLIDLRKAFPSVDRQELIQDRVNSGVSAMAVQVFKRLYVRDTFQLLLDGVPGTLVFTVIVGVHKGSCLSPSLFIFFIHDLSGTLQSLVTNIDCSVVGGHKIFCMVFADDVNVFSLKIPGTQQLVDGTTRFFTQRRLIPNPNKCEFLAITGPRR